MYHSSVVLVPDGRVLVGESNPHEMDNFRRTFPTDLNLEVFHPPYLAPLFASLRPSILTVETRDDTLPERGVYRRRFELGNKARRRRDIRDVSVACKGMIGKFNKRTASDRDGEHGWAENEWKDKERHMGGVCPSSCPPREKQEKAMAIKSLKSDVFQRPKNMGGQV
ncbi:hypothetical protein COP2_035966 [Malus domestica]